MTDEEAAELATVIVAVSEYLRTVDEPVPAFTLRGVADALGASIRSANADD
jgi:hypothetical protein